MPSCFAASSRIALLSSEEDDPAAATAAPPPATASSAAAPKMSLRLFFMGPRRGGRPKKGPKKNLRVRPGAVQAQHHARAALVRTLGDDDPAMRFGDLA